MLGTLLSPGLMPGWGTQNPKNTQYEHMRSVKN